MAVFLQHRLVPGGIAVLAAIFEHALAKETVHTYDHLWVLGWAVEIVGPGNSPRDFLSSCRSAPRNMSTSRPVLGLRVQEFRAWGPAVSVLS